MKRLSIKFLSVFLILFALAQIPAKGAVLAERIPEDAIFYLGWKGGDALKGDYAKSNLKQFIDASGIPAWLADRTDWLLEKLKKEEPEAEAGIRIALSVAGKMWAHPTAAYFGPMDLSNMKQAKEGQDQPPMPCIALICDAAADGDALIAEIKPLIAKIKDSPVPIDIRKQGTLVIFTVGKLSESQTATLNGAPKGGTLATAEVFKSAMKEVEPDPAVALYVDMKKVSEQADAIVAALPDKETRELAGKIVSAVNLNGFTQIALTGSFSGKEWTDRSFVGLAPGEHKGLTKFFDPKPMDEAILKWVPQDVTAFSVMRVDLPAIYDEVRSGIKAASPDVAKLFDRQVGMMRQMVGVDLRKDVLDPFSDTMILYRTPAQEGSTGGMVFIAGLKDEKKMTETLDALETWGREAGLPLADAKEKIAGVEASVLLLKGNEIVWAVYKGNLIISTAAGFELAVKQIKAGKTSVLDNPKYVAVRKSLGGGPAASISYHDPAAIYPEFAATIAPLLIVANMAGAQIPADFLPDPEKVAPILTPGGSVTWMDEKGSHSSSRSAFPGVSILAGKAVDGPVKAVLAEPMR